MPSVAGCALFARIKKSRTLVTALGFAGSVPARMYCGSATDATFTLFAGRYITPSILQFGTVAPGLMRFDGLSVRSNVITSNAAPPRGLGIVVLFLVTPV